jgi:WD40 repeat protein/tRNA A-37 threonylcarbamoyl transferase component Bud32
MTMTMISTNFCPVCGAANNQPAHSSCSACGQLLAAGTPSEPTQDEVVLRQRYQLGTILGTGGFSVVYRARDLQTERNVAIKQVALHGRSAQEVIEATDTFNRETSLLSGLCHPQIPQLFDHFSDHDHWYLVLQYLEGPTLETYLETRITQSKPLLIDEVLALAFQLCSVLEYLHTRQPPIIFRDLKPSNIIRSKSGMLSLIDFGIARSFRPGQARDTQQLGSPGYAAPEQYGRAQTTPQSDIYSLGIILYEVLSGQDPTERVHGLAPLRLDQEVGGGELAALIQRMSSPHPSERPATVGDVAATLEVIRQQRAGLETRRLWLPPTPQDLPAFGEGHPFIQIQQLSASRSYRHTSRRKVLISLGMLIATGAVGSVWWANTSHPLLDFHPSSYVYRGHTGKVIGVAWSPDSKRIASASEDGTLQVWDAAKGRQIWSYQGSFRGEKNVAWSPDGKHIASASEDGTLQVWDAATGSPAFLCQAQPGGVSAVAWSPDGKHIASSYGTRVAIWDATTGKLVFTYLVQTRLGEIGFVTDVAWSPDGKYIALAQGEIQIWNATTWRHISTYREIPGWVTDVAWSPDGKHIALAGGDVQVWDVTTEENVFTYPGQSGGVSAVAWSPDGKHIASASKDVQVWDASTGENIFTYPEQRNTETIIAWSPNSKRIALAYTSDKIVQVWDAP